MNTIRTYKIQGAVAKLLRSKVFLTCLVAVLIFPLASTFLFPPPVQALGEFGWEKLGTNPIIPRGGAGAWDAASAGEPAVIKDGSTYKAWYTGQDAQGVFRIGYATSADGKVWTKSGSNPVLNIGGAGAFDAAGIASPAVIKDGATYKMWYMGDDANGTVAIGYATSSDGITWTKQNSGNAVFTQGAPWEVNGVGSPSVILDGSTLKMWYTGKSGGGIIGTLAIGYATSADGITWTRQNSSNPVLTGGASWAARGVGVPAVIKDGVIYKMWYTGYVTTQDTTNSSIGFASSSDGIAWVPYAGNPIISTGLVSGWEGRGVGGPAVINDGGAYKMWFSGLDTNLGANTGYAAIPNYTATTSALMFENPADRVIGVNHHIVSIASTGASPNPTGGVASFTATATFLGAGINILSVVAQSPFTVPPASIDNNAGNVTYSGSQSGSTPQAPMDVAYLIPKLVGSKDTDYTLTLAFNSINAGDTLPINQAGNAVLASLRRGDARADAVINITDALFIAQNLAQLKALGDDSANGTGTGSSHTLAHPLNAASVRYDDAVYGGERITIQDAMFIAQMLVGLRDASYNLI